MSKTDIYLNKEQRDTVKPNNPKFHRRRRKRRTEAEQVAFDDPKRRKHPSSKRRSRNRGSRHIRHVWKKQHIQKRLTWAIIIVTVLTVLFLALWQYWLRDYLQRDEQLEMEQMMTRPISGS